MYNSTVTIFDFRMREESGLLMGGWFVINVGEL